MKCPKCHSSDLKKISLIYAEGVRESRGGFIGWCNGNGVEFGRRWGRSESRLSAMLSPPQKFPYGRPIVLWLIAFFPLMAFVGRGKLSWATGLITTLYVFLLPAIPVGAFAYNLSVYPRKYAGWDSTLACRRCGARFQPRANSQSIASV
jgi:hypothetical protein